MSFINNHFYTFHIFCIFYKGEIFYLWEHHMKCIHVCTLTFSYFSLSHFLMSFNRYATIVYTNTKDTKQATPVNKTLIIVSMSFTYFNSLFKFRFLSITVNFLSSSINASIFSFEGSGRLLLPESAPILT